MKLIGTFQATEKKRKRLFELNEVYRSGVGNRYTNGKTVKNNKPFYFGILLVDGSEYTSKTYKTEKGAEKALKNFIKKGGK